MLRTRIWMGSILIALTVGMLLGDQHLAPWYPFLFVFMIGLGLAGTWELLGLYGPTRPAQKWVALLGIVALAGANWGPHLFEPFPGGPWLWIAGAWTGLTLLIFLAEMATFQQPGQSVERMARTLLAVAYLGLFPSFLVQQRWLFPAGSASSVALALTIFVPKCCDIGAYFTGRLLGRHKMTPVLSPKKTWEGAAGGLVLASVAAMLIDRLGPTPVLRQCWGLEIGFGLTVGVAGMLGDLAESLLKRDCQHKDASQAVPGFGGVLDVVDAVLFAAPMAFLWFVLV
jgi:phosphatidate cytidylyltransferase